LRRACAVGGLAGQRFAGFGLFASRAICSRASCITMNASERWSASALALSHAITSGASRKLTDFVGAILIVALALPAAAAETQQTQQAWQPPFSMLERLKAAEPIYASPEERQAVCDDMRAGV
jgi:hypothetical protein